MDFQARGTRVTSMVLTKKPTVRSPIRTQSPFLITNYAMSSVLCKMVLAGLCALLGFPFQANASAFLGRGPAKTAMLPLLEELERIVGKDHRSSTESRAIRLEEALRPTFLAMPKTPEGGVKPDAVRYMVHRYFVDRHGWFVDGLGSGGETMNNSSPATIFKDQGDDDVQDFFEVRFKEHSFSLHQVAVFAATLESFVHTETIERLNAAYRLLGISTTAKSMSAAQVQDVIESYMVMYVLGSNYSDVTPSMLRIMRARISEVYPTWAATKQWVGEVQREVLNSHEVDAPPPASFNFSAKVLEEIGDRYGRWQNSECVDLKNSLLKLEKSGTGRVPLETFYGSALQGNWQFSESIGYLRQLGALDESDSQRPSIVIPNYINAPSNCVASSKFYSVCCIDECEDLVGHLETRIAAPEASPERIIELVSDLSSPTTAAPRILPIFLVQRLEDIASHHHGTVPFHGRLFAQWMHHAYPRECSYPHLSGTLNPLTPFEWQKQTGENAQADKATMMWHIDTAKQAPPVDQEEGQLPWTGEEELFVSCSARSVGERKLGFWGLGKGVAGSGAILSVIVTVFRMLSTGKKAVFACPNEKYFV